MLVFQTSVVGAIPTRGTNSMVALAQCRAPGCEPGRCRVNSDGQYHTLVVQPAETLVLETKRCGFESHREYQFISD